MFELIIPSNVNKIRPLPGLKHSYNISDLRSLLGIGNTQTELERTPGAVAVSGYMAGAGRGVNFLPVSPKQTHPSSDTVKTSSSKLEHTCADSSWVLLAQCQEHPEEHNFMMTVRCGKEWCPVCGEKGSEYHKRRISRILPKAMQIQDMGYFVIEFPNDYRKRVDLAYSKKGLQQTTNKIVHVLAGKRMGRRGRVGGYFNRGLIRWHYYGDKHIKGNKNKWNPHANILVDSAFIDIDTLNEIRAALRQALDCPQLIVNYSYCDTPAKKYHHIAYITRSTFRNIEWNRYMAIQISERKLKRDDSGNLIPRLYKTGNKKGQPVMVINPDGSKEIDYQSESPFRNQRWWGHWEDLNKKPKAAVWHMDDKQQEAELMAANKIGNNECPVKGCGGRLEWSKPIHGGYIALWQAEEMGGTGFYRIPVKQFTGYEFTTDEVMRLAKLRNTYLANVYMRGRDFNIAWREILAYIDDNDFTDFEEEPGEIMREVQGEIYLN